MNTKRLSVIALLLLILSAGSVAADGTAFQQALFAPTVLDTTACHFTVTPGQNIQTAVQNAQSGQIVCVRAGTYHERVEIKPPDAGVTLMAYPGERPIIDGRSVLPSTSDNGNFGGLIHISGDNVTVDGFEVINSRLRGVAVVQSPTVSTPLQNVTVRNMIVHNNQDSGINVNGSDTLRPRNILIENNAVYDNLLKNRSADTGGAALTFIEVHNSTARGNSVYHNWGEGLVVGRWSQNMLIEGNTSYDNKNSNLYVINTTNPTVRHNLVYCTDDRPYWSQDTPKKPSSGIMNRDEDFEKLSVKPPPSSGQVFINNIVVGCSPNFGVSTQINGGGLNNALVANNTFVNGRGDSGAPVNNVLFSGDAVYNNTRFVNNLIYQTVPGSMVRVLMAQGSPNFSTFNISNNLYSSTPTNGWPNESGRVIGDARLVNPVLPTVGNAVNPANYGLLSNSPAINAGAAVSQVTDDFFRQARSGILDIGADELAGSGPTAGRIVVVKATTPDRAAQSFGFTVNYPPGSFQLVDGESHTSADLNAGTYNVAMNPVNGWTTAAVCSDGSNPNAIALAAGETVTCTFTSVQETETTIDATVYVSASSAGSVGGVDFQPGDILAYNGLQATWSLHFDGSDVGINKPINDFAILNNGAILMALNGKVNLNGPGGSFQSQMQDVVRFNPGTLGANTAGSWELYFDGQDVGLAAASEKIDALAVKSDGTLLISTYGRASVKNGETTVAGQDEDLLGFKPTSTGANTQGTWSLVFDGSQVTNLGSEDVTAAWYEETTGRFYLTMTDGFNVAGVSGTNQTVLAATSSGTALVYWNAAGAGFPLAVDGLHIAP